MSTSNVRHLTPAPSVLPVSSHERPQAGPLPTKRGEIGYRSSMVGSEPDDRTMAPMEDIPSAEDLEERLNSRNPSNGNGSGSSGLSTTVSGRGNGAVRTMGRAILDSLPRLPSQDQRPSPNISSVTSPVVLSDDHIALKKQQEKRHRLACVVFSIVLGCTFLVGSVVGYIIALHRDNQMVKDSQDIIDGDGGDTVKSSAPFIHSLFVLVIFFELVFIHSRVRDIYIIYNYGIESDMPEKPSLKSKLKKFAEWFLRVPETMLRPPPEALPSYIHALDMPGGAREGLGHLTREQRRQRRMGASRGTGDAEDVEVERAWRLGGGKGLPLYEGDDMKASTVLLTGPPLQPPNSPLTRRISVRISQGADMLVRLSRRISGLRAPQQSNTMDGDSLRPPPSPGMRSPRSMRSFPSTPVRTAYHASVILDLAAYEEDEKDTRDFGEGQNTHSPSISYKAKDQESTPSVSSSVPLSSPSSFSSAIPPSPTTPQIAHHRKRNSIVRHSSVRQPSALYSLTEGDNESNSSH